LRSIAAQAAAPATSSIMGPSSQRRTLLRDRTVWMAGVIAAIALSIMGTLLWTRRQSSEVGSSVRNEQAMRFTMFPGEGASIYSGYDMPFALSPDGRLIVWVGVSANGTKQLWLRPWDSEVAQPMVGTEGAGQPFWSPDSQWIGFFAENGLKKVRALGGLPQTVASGVVSAVGAAWSTTDVILIPSAGALSRVSAQGGALEQVTTPSAESGENGQFWPRFLEDNNHFIYSAVSPAGIYVASLDGDAPRILAPQGVVSALEYVPGYVLYVGQDGGLFARAFDDEALMFVGDPFRIVDGIPLSGPGRAPFSVSTTGVLAYWPYAPGATAVLQWFDRDGRSTPALDVPGRYAGFALSPDLRQLAFARVAANGRSDVWLRDMTRGSESRLTSDGFSFTPTWSPDGTEITYSGARGRPPDLIIRKIGDMEETLVDASPMVEFPLAWGQDGASIVSTGTDGTTGSDLWIWRLKGRKGTGERLSLNTRFDESQARISRDNRWIAYTTNESGRDEVWVANFPSGENRRQVSVAGGTAPEWGAGSAEIFYISRDKQVMATPFNGGEVGTPRVLFRIDNLIDPKDFAADLGASYPYNVTSDGQRFLAAVAARDPNAPPISIILNWPALLKR
jgi:Tol biopolymer transport system component